MSGKYKKIYDFNGALDLIKRYAAIYYEFETFQKKSKIMPTNGDQKTGVIGEMYIYQYLKHLYPTDKVSFGTTSQKGWDIQVGRNIYVQVKTVSAHSNYRTISPIHEGWTELFLVSLDKDFRPNGIWKINDPKDIPWKTVSSPKLDKDGNLEKDSEGKPIKHTYSICRYIKMKDPTKDNSRHNESFYKNAKDITSEVLEKLGLGNM